MGHSAKHIKNPVKFVNFDQIKYKEELLTEREIYTIIKTKSMDVLELPHGENGGFGREGEFMKVTAIDLYDHFGLPREGAAEGKLYAYFWGLEEGVGAGRTGPAVLIMPGGGYEYTSDREAEPIAMTFASRGYQAFVLRYSCSPARFPVPLREAAMAMRYIRENAKAYNVESNMVGAIGFSAGGHLCGMLGTMYDAPELKDIAPAEMVRPDALALCYPVAVSWGATHEGSFLNLCGEDEALRQRLSIEKQVRPDMPPTFLWHTRDDGCVPVRNSLLVAQALEEKGVAFAMEIFATGWHGLSLANELVYPVGGMVPHSPDVPKWPEKVMGFWKEMGFGFRQEAQL